jgi:acyl-CoA synthetase (AMP-forming)/AMP-acid ligase II
VLVGQRAEFIVSEVAILKFLARKLPKWQAPERSCSFDALPPTATGKLLKTELRQLPRASCRQRLSLRARR